MDTRLPYRRDIDGLRAVAVLAVMVFHLDAAFLGGGFTGVDVFFVISGYVVTASLLAHRGGGLKRFLLDFYGRRIARIIPALVVMLALTLVLYLAFIPIPWSQSAVPEVALYALLGAGNLALLDSQGNYFANKADLNPWLHTWSLGIEEQFYLIAPLLLFWGMQKRRSPYLAWGPLVLCAGFSLVLCAGLQARNPELNFYSVFTRFWELGAGTLLCLWHARPKTSPEIENAILRSPMGWVGLLLVVTGFVGARPEHSPFPDTLTAVLGTLLLIHEGTQRSSGMINRLLAAPLLVGIGKLSYSLYLWHWPVYAGLRWTIGLDSTVAKATALAASFVLAAISYRVIEQPVRRLPTLTQGPTLRAVTSSLVLLVGLSAIGFTLTQVRREFSLSEVTGHSGTWARSMDVREYSDGDCTVQTKQIGMQTHITPVCRTAREKGGSLSTRQVFVLGDSHAGHLVNALESLAHSHNLRSTVLSKADCSYILGGQRMSVSRCLAFNETRLRHVLEHAHPGDVVVLSSLRVSRYKLAPPDTSTRSSRQSWEKEFSLWLEPLLEAGLRVVISAPTPLFRQAIWRCLDPWLEGRPSCKDALQNERDGLLAHRADVMRSIADLLARYPQMILWDAFPILCPPGKYCRNRLANVFLFYDTDHLSPRGSEHVAASLLETLELTEKVESPRVVATPPVSPR